MQLAVIHLRSHTFLLLAIRRPARNETMNGLHRHQSTTMSESIVKNIVIIGGVAGGMSAATRARRLRETVSIKVLEKGSYVSYANCGIPYALGGVIKDDSALVLQTPEALKDRFNINVELDTEALKIDRGERVVHVRTKRTGDVRQIPYDRLILSQGAKAFRLPIAGANLPHVFTLQTIPDLETIRYFIESHKVKRVAIIGGGFIGIEAVEAMHRLGLEVSLLEYLPQLFPQIDPEMAETVHKDLRLRGIKLFLAARITRIESTRVSMAGGESADADMVLMAVGVRARTKLADEAGLKIGKTGVSVNQFMQTSDPAIYAIGDMAETYNRITGRDMQLALAGPASRQGRLAADHIFGSTTPYRGNVGTSVCKIFDLTVTNVGLAVKSLRSLGRDPLWVTVHPAHHATYYPGAQSLTLRVVFEPETGYLLGAQCIGKEGVDKRIDVLATAIQAEMTIEDLEHLELAYAPPYGSAKDPVNMAGFVGGNLFRGDVQVVHAEDLDIAQENLSLVDVRSPEEFSRGHITSARNIPLNTLRDRLSMLERSHRLVVYCQVGYRGYLAYRILKQEGFDVANLDGGFKSVVDGGYEHLQSCLE